MILICTNTSIDSSEEMKDSPRDYIRAGAAAYRAKEKLIEDGKITKEEWNKYYRPIKKELDAKYTKRQRSIDRMCRIF